LLENLYDSIIREGTPPSCSSRQIHRFQALLLLVPWAYLWARAVKRVRSTNGDWGLFAGAVGAWVLVIVIAIPVVNNVMTASTVFNRVKAEAEIASGIEQQATPASARA